MDEVKLTTTPEQFALEKGISNEETEKLAKQKLTECYERTIKVLKKYIDMEEKNYIIIAIWIIGTYFHETFNTYPYLYFNAMRGSAKTRILKLISSLGAKGDSSVQNNLTEAVLFRIPRGTITCIDEVEQIGSKEKQTLRELLNSAYKKGMNVKRMRKMHTKDGEMQVTETFKPYFPIAMANIWGMDEVLGDRAITIILEKSNSPSHTKLIEDFDTNPEIQDIKRTLNQVSVVCVVSLLKKTYTSSWNNYVLNKYTNSTTTLHTYTTQTTLTTLTMLKQLELEELFSKIDNLNINGRNLELFLPLIIIAEELYVLDTFLIICNEFTSKRKEDEYTESKDISLYDFISSLKHEGLNYLFIKDLTRRFRDYLGDSQEEDKWLNEKWLGRALKRLNLIIDVRRFAQGKQVILNYIKALEKLKIFKKGAEEK